MVRNGHDYKGAQEYYCHDCQSYGTLQVQRGYDERMRSQVKRAVLERISLRRGRVLVWVVAAHCGSMDCRLVPVPPSGQQALGQDLGIEAVAQGLTAQEAMDFVRYHACTVLQHVARGTGDVGR